jgi:2-polyprenyl-3-methyl-5-hydroxy-6-metoxy-1,4-benzoquinol methylase
LIRQQWGPAVRTVLDVSCGIGTQALGLAQRGYDITASDLSPKAIERARREAEIRGLRIDFSVADMRQAHENHQRAFDVVISCDNSVPHLLSDTEIQLAFASFYFNIMNLHVLLWRAARLVVMPPPTRDDGH